MAFAIERQRITVSGHLRMTEAGILRDDDPVELIEGEIADIPPVGATDAGTLIRLTRLFVQRAGTEAPVSVRNPLGLGEDSMPQPELVLLRPRPDCCRTGHPGPDGCAAIETRRGRGRLAPERLPDVGAAAS